MRERWFGASGIRVPEVAVEGDDAIPVAPEPLVVDDVTDARRLQNAHAEGRPVVVRADTAAAVKLALARPEVSCVLVPPRACGLLDLDLTELTYG